MRAANYLFVSPMERLCSKVKPSTYFLERAFSSGWDIAQRKMGEISLNENRIQQVLEIEKQANEIRDEIIRSAALLPVQAEKEAQAMIEKGRAEAQDEANQLLAKAQAEQDSAEIMSQANEKILRIETLAKGNFTRAVAYVVARVTGRE